MGTSGRLGRLLLRCFAGGPAENPCASPASANPPNEEQSMTVAGLQAPDEGMVSSDECARAIGELEEEEVPVARRVCRSGPSNQPLGLWEC